MPRVDYDAVAPAFDDRYAHQSFVGVERALRAFIGPHAHRAIVEIGCGTGHWTRLFAGAAELVVGLDRSWGMLERARSAGPRAALVRGTAERLPLAADCVDRVFCVNALHHFDDPQAFLRECRRILRAGGTLLTIALDPHTGFDRWWIYDYFPAALAADLRRYLATGHLRQLLADAGFASAATELVQHVPAERSFDVALEQGLLDRRSTSQLMVISDAEYETGMQRLLRERPLLRSDLRLFATTARRE